MKAGPLTWLGLLLAGLGWVVLVGALVVSDATLSAGTLVATLSLRADLVTIGQSAILSGFGLAIVGTLRSGFGAFSRFFDAVLQRSSAPRPAPSPEPEPTAAPAFTAGGMATIDRGAPPAPPPPLKSRERNYVILNDGSVEVETMFGTRVFATLDEARDFIR